jgi:phosphate transport system substrate-binding protein
MKTSVVLFVFLIGLAGILTMNSSCNSRENAKNSGGSDTISGTLSLSGAFALYPMTVRWAEEFRKLHPNVSIDISAGGAGKGMTDALSQVVDLGMFSREVSPEEQAKGAWWIALTKDAVLATINAKNPEMSNLLKKGLTRKQYFSLFLDEKPTTWGNLTKSSNKDKVVVYTRSDACGAAEMWAKFMGKKQDDLKGVGVFGDPGIADAVKKDINGLGYNNLNYVYDCRSSQKFEGMEVVPLDLNENGNIDPSENFYQNMDSVIVAIRDGRYPSPPSRDLYFVSKGKPTNPLAIAFISWILTDGQKFVKEAGYVNLTPEKLEAEKAKIK